MLSDIQVSREEGVVSCTHPAARCPTEEATLDADDADAYQNVTAVILRTTKVRKFCSLLAVPTDARSFKRIGIWVYDPWSKGTVEAESWGLTGEKLRGLDNLWELRTVRLV